MIKCISVASLAMLGLFAGSTFAAEGAGRYTGIAIGQVAANIDDVDFDESDTGYKFFGGFMFNKNFGLEVAYLDGANPEQSTTRTSIEISPSAFTIEGVGRVPLGKSFAVFGKVGIAFYDVEIQGRVLGAQFYSSDSGSEIIYGVGASLGIGERFELRAEWEQLTIDIDDVDGDVSMISLGGVFKF